MAYRYAELGSKVLLVDADHVRGGTARTADPGADEFTALVEGERGDGDKRTPSTRWPIDAFTHTDVPNLIVVGHDASAAPMTRRARLDVMEVMEAARKYADVVIFDTGPILDSVSSIKLAQHADVTVLVVPVRRQRRGPLRVIARQLEGHDGLLLPVTTDGARRVRRSRRAGDGDDVRTHRGPAEAAESEPADASSARPSEEAADSSGRVP
jgi:Mrp family chromosome partitioning ATPase